MLQARSSFWTHAKNRTISPPPPSRQGRLFPPCRGIPVISCVLRGARNDVAAARLYLLDDRQHIGRKAVCICPVGGCHFAFTGGDENMNPGISCGVAGVACELLLRIM